VARDGGTVKPEDLQAVLAEHLVTLDGSARKLASRCDGLLDMMFAEGGGGVDPAATLELVTTLDRLRRGAVADLQKVAGLLHHINSPRSPRVTVIAAAQANAINDTRASRRPVDLGEAVREDS